MAFFSSRFSYLVVVLLLAGCGLEGASEVETLAERVRQEARGQGLDGDPADGMAPVRPDEEPLVNLGKVLFFSRTLSGRMDVACATCHHPLLAAGDNLTLPVGVAALQPEILGLGRTLDPEKDRAPNADFGPNVPRNSPTTFNVALYDRTMFFDGRVFVLETAHAPGGAGQAIRTPESGSVADPHAGDSLLEAQAKLPLASNEEMRDFMYPELSDPQSYRDRLVDRLRGNVDQGYLAYDAADKWQALFASVFDTLDDGQLITQGRIIQALAAFQRSQIFVDTPWRRFMAGETGALSAQAVRGAWRFFRSPDEGGLGCAGCHSGDHFTDEAFHNTGFPQIGRGKRTDGSDRGRADVNTSTQTDANLYAFRTPSLLNVGVTAPYGHAGTFATLEQVLQYHANPRDEVERFDFDLQHLPQAQFAKASGLALYPEARALTDEVLAASSFATAEGKLPARTLTATEIADLVAFLEALTDACVVNSACVAPWIATGVADNPDGNLLVMNEPFTAPAPPPSEPYPALDGVPLAFPALPALESGFEEGAGCSSTPFAAANTGTARFVRRDAELGLSAPHGFSILTWLTNEYAGTFAIDESMQAGGLAASYLSGACWPDLLFMGGDAEAASSVVLYRNRGGQEGFEQANVFAEPVPGVFASAGIVDLNGDYRRELVLGNLHQRDLLIYARNVEGGYSQAAALPMGRSTFGIGAADTDGAGFPELFFAHWSAVGLPGSAPAFWRNTGGTLLLPADAAAGTTSDDVTQNRNFAPGFADLNADGFLDLLIASDFTTSVIMRNDGASVFEDVTDRAVIDESNGMGSAIADFNNDGMLDWFVTSIDLPEDETDNYGNRLYWNRTAPGSDTFVFDRDVFGSGVKPGGWGWAACAADFDNDGWLDIFHVNGYGYIPEEYDGTSLDEYSADYELIFGRFRNEAPRLFINDGDETFTDQTAAWGLDVPSEGRGVVCLDYDRDGDMDIALVDHSTGLQFFENQLGNAGHGFISVLLEGSAPNTEALGAKVYVSADLNGDGVLEARETQIRVSAANSSFASQGPPDLHFGLGDADQVAQLRIDWPGSGVPDLECTNVPRNRLLRFTQRAGDAGQGICPE